MTALADLPASRQLGKVVHATSKHCYRNALHGYFHLAQTQGPAALFYVEGWALVWGGWLEHAWVELAGVVIDPTPAYYRESRVSEYRPHIRFSPGALSQALGDAREQPLSGCDLTRFNPARRPEYLASVQRMLELQHARLRGRSADAAVAAEERRC